ncbi:kinase-like protein [Exidia glandulosa HHB12029]|uniref:Kinase-like protein n=1 Tax=Exidia glandulosa HHB12029 TaxID=1314781 RepID=A0A165CIZ2_EXIGL|nr:kinase-like protein [Exidia glandulosa HHB12029]
MFVVASVAEYSELLPFLRAHPLVDRRRIVLQLLIGLRFLHELGIVHGNIHSANVQVDSSGAPILAGFGQPVLCRDEQVDKTRDLDWVDAQKELVSEWSILWTTASESDAPHETVVDATHYVPGSKIDISDDTAVTDVMKTRAANALLSFEKSGDMFALAFLIVEVFSEATPCTSVRTFQILCKALRRQRPLHPGLIAELRGLDRRHWDVCLSCWRVGPDDPWTLQQMVDRLSGTNGNIVLTPFGRNITDDELQLPQIDDHVRDIQELKEGRDAELNMQEIRGIWDQEGGKVVVIKIITPAHCRRGSLRRPHDFLAEAYMWSQLHHPNILPLIATVRYDLTECFVVPWMAGGTCVDFLRANPDADRLALLLNVGDALHYLHTREPTIIHGYVRARSVLVSEDGVAYLGNFDFLRLQDPERNPDTFDESYIDKAGRWNAPELSIAEYTTKSDVFGFAMFAYEVYSGQIPYHTVPEHPGFSYVKSVWDLKVAGHRPERPSSGLLTDKLWDLIQRCWDQAPRLRPSMGTVVRELGQIQTEGRAPHESS